MVKSSIFRTMKQKYECTNCSYKFVPKTDRIPKKCPYCGTPGIRPAAKAQDIVTAAIRKEY